MPRPFFLPAPWRALPAGPVVAAAAVGVAYAQHDGLPLRAVPAVLCVLAAFASHAGLSSALSLADPDGSPEPAGPQTAPRSAVVAAVACVAALVLGLSAALLSQPLVFLAGALGALLAVALVLPALPFAYLGSGIGETILVVLAGPVPVVAAYASQGGGLHPGVLLASTPPALFALGVVFCAHRAFSDPDATDGRLTLAVIVGPKTARWLPWGALALAYLSLPTVVRTEEFPPGTLAGLATLPAAVWVLARGARDPSRKGRLRDTRFLGWVVTVTLALVAGAMLVERW